MSGLAAEAHPCPGTIMKHGMTVCLYFLPPQRAKDMDWCAGSSGWQQQT